MAKIHVFKAGYCTHPACIAVRGEGLKSCQFPAQVFLLECQNRFWLWDTGYANHFMDATQSGIFRWYRRITPVYFESEQSIYRQLKQQGLLPKDLSGLIISHFHADHMAGLKDFPNTPIIVSQHAWDSVKNLQGFRALIKGFVPDLIPRDFERQQVSIESFRQVALDSVLQPFKQGFELPHSNGEIVLIPLPGHAAGHFGVMVLTDTGWQLLASDAAWSYKNYRHNQLPMKPANLIMDNVGDFYQTLQHLKQLDESNIPIILSHEEIACD